jgi:auxin efflux carrier family
MNFKFIAVDVISKAIVLLVLCLWGRFAKRGILDWVITLFSLSTLPNTLVMAIPLLKAMYGENAEFLMVQTVVLQCIIWYTLLLFLFEYRSAKILIAEQFPGVANSIASFKVGSDVMSLDGRELLQTDGEMGEDGKLHVIVRKSSSSQGNSAPPSQRFQSLNSIKSFPLGRPANNNNTDVYSLQSSRNLTPRDSSFNRADYVSMMSSRAMSPLRSNTNNGNSNNNSPHVCDVNSLHSSQGHTPRTSNCIEDHYRDINSGIRTTNSNSNCNGGFCHGYKSYISTSEPLENGIRGDSVHGSSREQRQLHGGGLINSGCRSLYNGNHLGASFSPNVVQLIKKIPDSISSPKIDDDAKELHMFVWSSSGSPVSEGGFQLLGGSDFSMGDSLRREFDNIREERGTTTPLNDQTGTRGTFAYFI